jgi:hypothetical protein
MLEQDFSTGVDARAGFCDRSRGWSRSMQDQEHDASSKEGGEDICKEEQLRAAGANAGTEKEQMHRKGAEICGRSRGWSRSMQGQD